ncbi:hypothetical protein [Sphingobacterium sp. UBA3549]|uniref:hypothetical protein n=1 Tax=Sphingobacterium sp. UBA3549 TaxID=1947496 RepID=UPI0025F720E3|nr:hypothetical protein [Sphingobacterium sp. UBA3549]
MFKFILVAYPYYPPGSAVELFSVILYQSYCSDQLKMYDFWGARCMIFCAMAPGLFFEVVFLLLNGSAHFWDERSNFRGKCQIWWDG